jgi:hypothetical protein
MLRRASVDADADADGQTDARGKSRSEPSEILVQITTSDVRTVCREPTQVCGDMFRKREATVVAYWVPRPSASRSGRPSVRGMWMPTISLMVGMMSAGVAGTANCPFVIPAPRKASGTRWS